MKTDNELIAEFMGWTRGHIPDQNLWSRPGVGMYSHKTWELLFDKSWDWLMPVVEKIHEPHIVKGRSIRTSADVYINYKACSIEYSGDEESGDDRGDWTIQTQGETKIEAVYKAVVEFIKWYNASKI